ncbi:MAG: acyltransferase [Myxococcota bacterium]|nr:acyltransferase [Myxococcales bacterium]
MRVALRAIRARDRRRLARLARAHPGVAIHPGASTNLAVARFELGPGARVEIGDGVVTERTPRALRIHVAAGGELRIGAGTWLRTEVEGVQLVVYPGARMTIGADGFLNGCFLSAKSELATGLRTWIGPGSRVYDADQHDIDAETPERRAPVRIGDFTWIASGVTVLKGVTIGSHCVVGAHSLVTSDVPDHALAFGVPARARGRVGDRSSVRP